MSLYEIVLMLSGISLFLLGLAIGGVIEYKRLAKRVEEREEVYLYNLEQTAKMIYRIENKLESISIRNDSRWEITKEAHLAVMHLEKEKTQILRMPERTPSLPWRFDDDPDVTDPGVDV